MRIRSTFIALLIAVCSCYSSAQTAGVPPKQSTEGAIPGPTTNPQKAADIRRLLQVTGASGVAVQLMRNMETDVRPSIENSLPPGEYRARLVDLFLQKFQSNANEEALVALLIPVYEKHFSDEEIKQLTAFYETPLGKKAISELPAVVSESQQIGRQWGMQLGQDSMNEVLEEHPDLKKALVDAQQQNTYPWIKQ